jgi:hypothetical protein
VMEGILVSGARRVISNARISSRKSAKALQDSERSLLIKVPAEEIAWYPL